MDSQISDANWYYQGNPIEELPEDCVGFVYLITNLSSGRKYIGKKLAKFSKTTYKTKTLKNGKKKKQKIEFTTDINIFENAIKSQELIQIFLKTIASTSIECEFLNQKKLKLSILI